MSSGNEARIVLRGRRSSKRRGRIRDNFRKKRTEEGSRKREEENDEERERAIAQKCERERERKERKRGREIVVAMIPEIAKEEGEKNRKSKEGRRGDFRIEERK